MEKKQQNNRKTAILEGCKKALAFVFALLIGNEIFYFAKGNTYFYNISTLLDLLIVIFFCFLSIKNVLKNFWNIGALLFLFVIVIFLSYISAIFFSQSPSEFLVTLKGTVVFGLECCLTVFTTLLFASYVKEMAFGLYFSVILNCLFSLLVLATYRLTNYVITFSTLAPQSGFYVPNGGDVQLQGFFREPAHLTNFLVISFFILFHFFKGKAARLLLFVSVFSVLLIAGSGNIVVFVIGFIFVGILEWREIVSWIRAFFIHSKKKAIAICISVGIVIVAGTVVIFKVPSLSRVFLLAIKSINPLDPSNAPRLKNNLLGLEIIAAYPFGTGFNMSSIAGARLHPTWSVTAVQNYLLQIADETTLVGAVVYSAVWLVPLFKLSSKKHCPHQQFLAAALLCVFILEIINGSAYLVHYFVLGIAYCTILSFKKKIPAARPLEVETTYINIGPIPPIKAALMAGPKKSKIWIKVRNQLFWD